MSPGGHCVFASLARMIGTFDLELQRRERRSAKHRRVQRNVGAKGLLFVVSLHSDETRWADSEHQWGLVPEAICQDMDLTATNASGTWMASSGELERFTNSVHLLFKLFPSGDNYQGNDTPLGDTQNFLCEMQAEQR